VAVLLLLIGLCGTTFSPAGRDFATLNLLICGKLKNRSIWEEKR